MFNFVPKRKTRTIIYHNRPYSAKNKIVKTNLTPNTTSVVNTNSIPNTDSVVNTNSTELDINPIVESSFAPRVISKKNYNINICCCIVFTISFIISMSIWFAVVVPNQNHVDDTEKTTCIITNFTTTNFTCCEKKDCSCITISSLDSCSSKLEEKSSGYCRDGSCCLGQNVCREYCEEEVCHVYTDRTECETTRYCCGGYRCNLEGMKKCRIVCGLCYNSRIVFIRSADGNKLSTNEKCGRNDIKCVEKLSKKYTIGSNHDCWYKPSDPNYHAWNSPNENEEAFGFGIFFFIVTTISFISIFIPYWRLRKES